MWRKKQGFECDHSSSKNHNKKSFYIVISTDRPTMKLTVKNKLLDKETN